VFIRFPKLIANVCRDARLNSARAGGNENQANREHPFLSEMDTERSIHHREREMTEAVNNGEIKDRPVFPQPAVGYDRAEKRHPVN
jgi:hypothetical protein